MYDGLWRETCLDRMIESQLLKMSIGHVTDIGSIFKYINTTYYMFLSVR